MDLEDAGTRVKFVLHDRDASFTAAFDSAVPSRWRQGGPLRGPGAANEFDYGTLGWELPARARWTGP